MKTERSLRLSLWLPIIASATLFTLWSALTWYQYQHLAGEDVASEQQFVAHDLSALQKDLERNYADGQFLRADQAVAGRSRTAGYEALVILDTEGQILHASNPNWVHHAVADVLPAFDLEESTALIEGGFPSFSYINEKQHLLAYLPIFTATNQTSSSAEVVGSIYLEFRYQEDTGALVKRAIFDTLPLFLILAFAMALFVGLLHVYITRPAQHLVAATAALAAGNRGLRSNVSGKGELAHISQAFNQMSSELEDQHLRQKHSEKLLRKSEGRLKQAQRMAKVGHYHLNTTTNSWTSSAQLNDIFGIDESFPHNTEGWISLIHPEDAQRLADYLQHDVLERNQPFDLEYRILNQRTGKEIWVHGLGRLEHDHDGKVTGMFGAIQDITNRRRNERALSEATNIINRSSTVAFLWKNMPDRPVEFVSENVAPLLGYSKQEFEQNRVAYVDLIHPRDSARVTEDIVKNSANTEQQSFTHAPYRIVTKEGKTKWVDDVTFLRRNEKGEVTHLEGLVTDITERELHRQLKRFLGRRAQKLLEIPGEAEAREEDDFLQHCLAIAEDLTGSSTSFLHLVQDGEPAVELSPLADALLDHQPIVVNDYANYERKRDLPKGHARLNRFISLPVIDSGHVVMLMGVGNKTSDYQGLDVETLQLLANDIWRIVRRTQIEQERERLLANTNNRMREVRGLYQMEKLLADHEDLTNVFKGAVQIVPKAWRYPESACARIRFENEEYCSPGFQETKWRQCEEIVVFGTPLGSLEIFYRDEKPTCEEGPFLSEERDLLTSFALSLSRAVNHARLMAAQETTELQLRQVQKMEAVGQLTGGIAHDFNNILCIILGNVDLLEMEINPNDSILQRVQTIGKSAQRAADLTKQLLGFSRSQATQVVPIDINEAIEAMHTLITRTLTPTIEINQNFAVDLWNTEIDGADFEDALLNLVLNARDAMPRGGSLTITTQNTSLSVEDCAGEVGNPSGDYIQLKVSDTGEGIPYSLQEHVFEPFFSTKAQGKGTGLGLAMVYGFVQRSKGTISCSSEPNMGTTFTIRLPRSASVEQSATTIEPGEADLPRGTETILVVDDEIDLLEIAKHSLEGLGYRVITALNGGQALLQLAAHDEIDLLFTDIVMPGGINGQQVVKQSVQTHPELRTLMTSGYSENTMRSDSDTSPQAVLRKPYSQAELARQIRLALDMPPVTVPTSTQESVEAPIAQPFEWTPDLALGIDILDDDHQVLLQLINHGQQLLEVENASAKTAFILRELKAYSESHFEREEIVMQACGYPEFENHRQVHQLLLQKLEALFLRQRQGTLRTSDFAVFLSSWWEDHVRIMDQAIAPHCVGKEDRIAESLDNYFITKLHQD